MVNYLDPFERIVNVHWHGKAKDPYLQVAVGVRFDNYVPPSYQGETPGLTVSSYGYGVNNDRGDFTGEIIWANPGQTYSEGWQASVDLIWQIGDREGSINLNRSGRTDVISAPKMAGGASISDPERIYGGAVPAGTNPAGGPMFAGLYRGPSMDTTVFHGPDGTPYPTSFGSHSRSGRTPGAPSSGRWVQAFSSTLVCYCDFLAEDGIPAWGAFLGDGAPGTTTTSIGLPGLYLGGGSPFFGWGGVCGSFTWDWSGTTAVYHEIEYSGVACDGLVLLLKRNDLIEEDGM